MQLIKILGMAAIPIIILIVQCGTSMHDAILQQGYASDFKAQMEFAVQAGDVAHTLGLERGTTTFYLSMLDDQLLPPVLIRCGHQCDNLFLFTEEGALTFELNCFLLTA